MADERGWPRSSTPTTWAPGWHLRSLSWNRTRSPPRFPRTWQSTYGGESPQGPRRRLGPARECRL